MQKTRQSGSHIIAVALFLLVVGVVAYTGYKVYQMQRPAQGPSTQAANVAVPQKITSSADLSQAATSLDSATASLNTSLDSSVLNADINNML